MLLLLADHAQCAYAGSACPVLAACTSLGRVSQSDVHSASTQVQKAVAKGAASKQKAAQAAAKAQPVVTGSRRTSRVTKSRTMTASGFLPCMSRASCAARIGCSLRKLCRKNAECAGLI